MKYVPMKDRWNQDEDFSRFFGSDRANSLAKRWQDYLNKKVEEAPEELSQAQFNLDLTELHMGGPSGNDPHPNDTPQSIHDKPHDGKGVQKKIGATISEKRKKIFDDYFNPKTVTTTQWTREGLFATYLNGAADEGHKLGWELSDHIDKLVQEGKISVGSVNNGRGGTFEVLYSNETGMKKEWIEANSLRMQLVKSPNPDAMNDSEATILESMGNFNSIGYWHNYKRVVDSEDLRKYVESKFQLNGMDYKLALHSLITSGLVERSNDKEGNILYSVNPKIVEDYKSFLGVLSNELPYWKGEDKLPDTFSPKQKEAKMMENFIAQKAIDKELGLDTGPVEVPESLKGLPENRTVVKHAPLPGGNKKSILIADANANYDEDFKPMKFEHFDDWGGAFHQQVSAREAFLSPEEQSAAEAFLAYKKSTYTAINKSLRGIKYTTTVDAQPLIEAMVTSIEKDGIAADENFIAYRGTHVKGIGKLYDKFKTGKTVKYSDKGFMSTTVDFTIAEGWSDQSRADSVVFEMHIPKGMKVTPLKFGALDSEREVLISPSQKWNVVGMHFDGAVQDNVKGHYYVVLEPDVPKSKKVVK